MNMSNDHRHISGRRAGDLETGGRDTVPLPDGLTASEHRDCEFLWKRSAGLSASQERMPTEQETESALEAVHQKLKGKAEREAAGSHRRSPQDSSRRIIRQTWIWWSAAAVILISMGAGYLFTPVKVAVPNGEQAVVELRDGSVLELNSGTTIRYSRFFGYFNRDVTLDGEAFVTVGPGEGSSGRHPFVIYANRSVVEVTGTRFNIRSRSDEPGTETRVYVDAGSVSLYPTGVPERIVQVNAGSWSRWNPAMETPTPPEPAALDEMAAWRENRFVFRNEPLGAIFREIERRFDIAIHLEAEQYATEHLTAHYSDPPDAEKMVEDLCQVKGLRYARTANGFRVFQ
ncbi:FecR domain-containing protein [Balneolales bacterium ANBcel1]|nr:FecR domain-containing protein [Balneolales bacterium ANBcel1]